MSMLLSVALVALVVSAIWLVIELVLIARAARPVVESAKQTLNDLDCVVKKADEVIEQVKPVIDEVGKTIQSAQPAVVQIEPLLVQATNSIGALSEDLQRIDGILGDVSRTTTIAGNAAAAMNEAASSLASRARGILGRGKQAQQNSIAVEAVETPAPIGDAAEAPGTAAVQTKPESEPAPAPGASRHGTGFFTYPQE